MRAKAQNTVIARLTGRLGREFESRVTHHIFGYGYVNPDAAIVFILAVYF